MLSFYTGRAARVRLAHGDERAATHQPGQQIVGQIAGDDGFYWQLGVIVAPSTFGIDGHRPTSPGSPFGCSRSSDQGS